MGYVEENLMKGESVVYRTDLHWAVFTGAIGLGLLAMLLLVAGAPAVGLVFLAIAGLAALAAYVSVATSEFVVTNKRVMIKVGWLTRRSLEVLLSKVEGIGVEQDLSGKLFGYGTIIVNGTGGTRERFKNIDDPFEFRKHVQEEVARAQDADRVSVREQPPLPPGREERECPYCAERILAKARLCKHCGREVQPLTQP